MEAGRRDRAGVAAACVLLFAGIVPGSIAAQPADNEYLSLYDTLWTVISRHYHDPDFGGVDWAGLRGRYRDRARTVRDDEAFRALSNDLLSELGSSHLRIFGPDGATPTTGIGARFTTVDDEVLVTDVAADSDAQLQGLRPGDRLLSPRSDVRGKRGSTATLEFERCGGDAVTLEIRREQVYWPIRPPYLSWSRSEVAGHGSVTTLRVSRFDDGAADEADAAMAELLDADTLIIDLRRTIGGNMSALRLASWFAPAEEAAFALVSRRYLQTLGRSPRPDDLARLPRVSGAYTGGAVYDALNNTRSAAMFWTESVPRRFEGRVYVLIGENTRSAAEAFAWYMRRHTDAVLIGRPTAGSLLSAREFPIGDGWWVSVPVHGVWGADGKAYSDRPAPPHVETAWTREDHCSGRDPDIEATALWHHEQP